MGFVLDQIAAMYKTRLDPLLMPTELAEIADESFVEELLVSVCRYLQVDERVDLAGKKD